MSFILIFFFFSSRRRHTRWNCDWSSDVCSSDLITFTGDPLPDSLEITGSPEATVYVAIDEGAESNLVVKICDVGPDGHSALVTTGWAKASHQRGHDEPLEFRIPLWATSYVVQAGHRLRLSISCSD